MTHWCIFIFTEEDNANAAKRLKFNPDTIEDGETKQKKVSSAGMAQGNSPTVTIHLIMHCLLVQ